MIRVNSGVCTSDRVLILTIIMSCLYSRVTIFQVQLLLSFISAGSISIMCTDFYMAPSFEVEQLGGVFYRALNIYQKKYIYHIGLWTIRFFSFLSISNCFLGMLVQPAKMWIVSDFNSQRRVKENLLTLLPLQPALFLSERLVL